MTAASAAYPLESRNAGDIERFRMKASTQIWAGEKVMLNTSGTAESAADGATGRAVIGTATKDLLSGASVAAYIPVQEGTLKLAGTTLGQADVGLMHYSTDSLTADDVPGVNSLALGPMIEYVSASLGWFRASWKNLPLIVQKKTRVVIPVFAGALATIADGDLLTDWTAGFIGEIIGLVAHAHVVASTASKTSAISVEIGSTGTTGGVLTLTTAGLDTIGKVMTSTAITALSVFTAANTLSVVAASTTQFGEGEITMSLILDQFFGA